MVINISRKFDAVKVSWNGCDRNLCDFKKKSFHFVDICTRELSCYNSLYAHLNAEHSDKYLCPYCGQKMDRIEHTITEHLSQAHPRFQEFQCLICVADFNTIQGICEHMSQHHPSNFLFVGARRTTKPYESIDKIQLLYVGKSPENLLLNMVKYSKPYVFDAMKPTEMIPSQQLATLKNLANEHQNQKTVVSEAASRILGATSFNIIKCDKYEILAPLIVQYKCITNEVIQHVHGIESHIDRSTETECNENANIHGPISSMLRHRCLKHSAQPIVFLQIQQRGAQSSVHKLVRCQFKCQRCHATFNTRLSLIRHFNNTHPNHWIAAIILMESQIIGSNKPKSPRPPIRSADFFYTSALACLQPNCMRMIGTRTQAIEHHNQEHHDQEFEFTAGEKIIRNAPQEIAAFVREVNESHQIHLFECHHCNRLFESLAKIQQHFMDVQCTESGGEFVPRFSMKKLFRCREDNVIRTFAGMKIHYEQKHAAKQFTPVNMLLPEQFCGLCDYNYKKNNDLDSHYNEKHARGGDSYSDALLVSMKLDNIDVNQCKFILGCCTNEEQTQLEPIVNHLMKCSRRFICQQCPDHCFASVDLFVSHCIKHGTNGAKIVENLQNIKTFLALLQNMTIVMPNRLLCQMDEIVNSTFGQNLSVQISQIAQDAWKREKGDLLRLIEVKNAIIN